MADNTISPVVPNVSGGRNVSPGQKAVRKQLHNPVLTLKAILAAGQLCRITALHF